MKIKDYLNDGANWQAQAVLAYLKSQDIDIDVTRYENCREQGYIFFKKVTKDKKVSQINVAVYEHRNSDAICIVVFEKTTTNDPLETDVWENMEDKWDTTSDFNYGEIVNCGDAIIEVFEEFESRFE